MFNQPETTPDSFNFGDSHIPENWKTRLCEKMAARAEVFSQSEWDMGCTKSVEHEIRLHDERPFRERSRHLPPTDFEDVRRHLQELRIKKSLCFSNCGSTQKEWNSSDVCGLPYSQPTYYPSPVHDAKGRRCVAFTHWE